MNVDISEILKAIGPAASIIFAAWIFMGFLQARYDAAFERFVIVVAQYREPEMDRVRRENIGAQIAQYRRRCQLMTTATILGLLAAIALLTTLITGELDILFKNVLWLELISAGAALLGFGLVIVAAAIVVVEATITYRQIAEEVLDVPDLATRIGRKPGTITGAKV